MTAGDLLHVSRLDELTARLTLELMHCLEAAWASHPTGQEFCLSRLIPDWLDRIAKEQASRLISLPASLASQGPVSETHSPILVPLPTITDPTHADVRLAGLALALDLIELCALYPAEPPDWVGRLALDRRTRTTFPKG